MKPHHHNTSWDDLPFLGSILRDFCSSLQHWLRPEFTTSGRRPRNYKQPECSRASHHDSLSTHMQTIGGTKRVINNQTSVNMVRSGAGTLGNDGLCGLNDLEESHCHRGRLHRSLRQLQEEANKIQQEINAPAHRWVRLCPTAAFFPSSDSELISKMKWELSQWCWCHCVCGPLCRNVSAWFLQKQEGCVFSGKRRLKHWLHLPASYWQTLKLMHSTSYPPACPQPPPGPLCNLLHSVKS